MRRVCIVGGSGFTGGELLRILLGHPNVDVVCTTSREFKGEYVARIHPNLRGRTNLTFSDSTIDAVLRSEPDAVFLALPHGQSINWVPKLHEVGLTIVDLSADFRLKDPRAYIEWYDFKEPHPYPDLLAKAVYGLPELHREELRGAKLIAVPGCMATAAILSLAPPIRYDIVDTDKVVVDAKISSSGAGAHAPRLDLHPLRTYVIRPYEVTHHRHTAEIEQELTRLAGREVKVAFTPHAVDLVRGILTTSHSWLTKNISELDLWRIYRSMYNNEPFVRIIKDKAGFQRYPDVKYVIGSNLVDVGFEVDSRLNRLVTLAAIDNLIKGASGQAVQAFNVAMGFDETAGLSTIPLYPV